MTNLGDVQTLMGIDFESTGVDVNNDRIVTATTALYDVAFEDPWIFSDYLINPGIEIPQGAINIHGITNEVAVSQGDNPKEVLPKIKSFIEKGWGFGFPLVGHNIGGYDLNLLNAELVRNDLEPLKIKGPILDTCDMFRMMGNNKATLAIATQKYGIVNKGAHDAKWDVVASIELLLAMMKESPMLRESSLRDLYTQQKVAHKMWAIKMRSTFTRMGKSFDSSNDWPVLSKWEE